MKSLFEIFIKVLFEEFAFRFIPIVILKYTVYLTPYIVYSILFIVIFCLYGLLYARAHKDYRDNLDAYLFLHSKYFLYGWFFGIWLSVLLHFTRNYLILVKNVKRPLWLFIII